VSFADGLWLALERGALVALAAVACAACINRRPLRRGTIIALALIWLTPTLLVGYAYSDGPFSLARHATWNELLYSSLLALKLLPVAVAVLHLSPAPPLAREAAFLRRLAPAQSELAAHRWRHALGFFLLGPGRNPALAFAVTLLLAFQDFELAALLNVAAGRDHSAFTWTIALHEARQLSAPTSDILSRITWVVIVQAAILAAAALLLWRTHDSSTISANPPARASRGSRFLAWTAVFAAFTAICLVPGFILLRGTFDGIAELLSTFRFGEELLSSLYFAIGATALVLALVHAAGAPRRKAGAGTTIARLHSQNGLGNERNTHAARGGTALPGRCSWRMVILAALCLPGLLGALVLGMLLMGAFQLPILRGFYDTPVPLILGLAHLALPVTMLLYRFFNANEPREAIYLAQMLRRSADVQHRRAGRSLLWSLRGRSWFLLAAFVFFFAYLELVVSVTLAPIAMTPAIVELYNQMHYGQRSLLSSLLAVTMAVPVVVAVLGWAALRLLSHRERTDSVGGRSSR